MPKLPVVLSWSGGKDSSLALAALRASNEYDVVALLTSITSGYDRVSIHGVRRALVEAQAAAVGVPLVEVTLEPLSSNEAYEAAFIAALARVRGAFPDVQHIAFGDLYLADVRQYRERLVRAAGFEPLFPLWNRDTTILAREFITSGFQAVLVCVDTTQLPASFAGRQFDAQLLADLPATVDPCGEGGEFHTFVHAGPILQAPISIRVGETVLRDERFAFADLLPAPVPRELRTERLVLRSWQPGDAPELVPILEANAEHLGPWTPARATRAAPIVELEQRLSGFAENFAADREWRFAMFSRDDEKILGEISLFPRDTTGRVPFTNADRAELGYWIRADEAGRGMVAEGARAVLDMARATGKFSRIEIHCDARNTPSNAVAKRLGFVLTDNSSGDDCIYESITTRERADLRAIASSSLSRLSSSV